MTLGERIRLVRKTANFNQTEFAKVLGLSMNYISLIEVGAKSPSDRTLQDISTLFGVSLDWLQYEVGRMKEEVSDKELLKIKNKFKLDDASFDILKGYFALTPAEREMFTEFLMRIFQKEAEPTRTVPFYGRLASAGHGQIVYDDFPADVCEVPNDSKYKHVIYGIAVNGDSMQPLLNDGDILYIEPASDIPINDIGIFILDGEAYVKKRGKSSLISINPAYGEIPFAPSIRCMGRVVL